MLRLIALIFFSATFPTAPALFFVIARIDTGAVLSLKAFSQTVLFMTKPPSFLAVSPSKSLLCDF